MSSATHPAIETQGLVVQVQGSPILGPLDLVLEEGVHALLVGPSGCGKTTLLRALAGLARPSAGSLSLFGVQVSQDEKLLVPPANRGIGFLFQGGALWPHMTVEAHLSFVMRGARIPRAEWSERRRELLALVDLEGFERRRPGTLSGGEGQRLGLARALATRPRLLLLDEPLGPLDADRRKNLLERLDHLRRTLQLTILHVTHDADEAAHLADCTLLMNANGRLIQEQPS